MTVLKNCFLDLNEVETLNIKISPTSEKCNFFSLNFEFYIKRSFIFKNKNFSGGEKPLFEELHSILVDNRNVIETDSKKGCVFKYWERRASCDLRMKVFIIILSMTLLLNYSNFIDLRISTIMSLKFILMYFTNYSLRVLFLQWKRSGLVLGNVY